MALLDWDAYRQQAGQETSNLNQMPFVMDPAKMTADPKANSINLYGKDVTDTSTSQAGLTKVVEDAFKQFYGRDAKQEDLTAWVNGAIAHGLDPAALRAGIEQAATKSQAAPGFNSGLMAGKGLMDSSFGNMSSGVGMMGG